MNPHPIRCFLFTDIEGSTKRWASDSRAMSAALERHDVILRRSIDNHSGTIFKTVGDAFCAVFASTTDAAAAAIAAQRALASEDWSAFGTGFTELRVRMAIHAGEAEHRDGDWFGPPLNRVARLLATGHGGQVLVSRAAQSLMGEHLPRGCSLSDLGLHRLKDLTAPERIFHLVDSERSEVFPALASLDEHPNNLPRQLDSFVGRTDELASLYRELGNPAGPRLVTLTGIGGTGKTRLAIQAAAELADRFAQGAWLVELAPLTSGSLLPHAITTALDLRDAQGTVEPIDAVVSQLSSRQVLLLLDNCEHLIESVASLVATLLQRCPDLRILATSREALAIAGEHCVPLGPLFTPTAKDLPIEVLYQSAAVQLFADRAAAAQPGFHLVPSNAPVVAELCRRLDGIPLAIELAAARVRAIGPEEILARLDDRLRLLRGSRRDRPSRQQTLRAAIDWSYDLLRPPDRVVLCRLAIFGAAVPLEAAEDICAVNGLDHVDVLDSIEGLVARSLLIPVERDDGSWYRMLESIRVYAFEKLMASGDFEVILRRQLNWYLKQVDDARIDRIGPAVDEALKRFRPLMADLHTLLRRTTTETDMLEPTRELLDHGWWLVCNGTSVDLPEGQATLAMLLHLAGSEGSPQRPRHPYLSWICGTALKLSGRAAESIGYFESAIQIAERIGDTRLETWACQELAASLNELGEGARAEGLIQRVLLQRRSEGVASETYISLLNLAEFERGRREYEKAAAWIEEGLALLSHEERESSLAVWGCHNLAQCRIRLGDFAAAKRALMELFALPHLEGMILASGLCAAAPVLANEGRLMEATRAFETGTELLRHERDSSSMTLSTIDLADWRQNLTAIAPTEVTEPYAEGARDPVEGPERSASKLARDLVDWWRSQPAPDSSGLKDSSPASTDRSREPG